ncbi:hypothetical protein AB0J72_40130 [Dactylosporangium sp. NPDC049742]|uniref:hypothetical protein n=1 Tax=Dactylosporangium sp. NPDC049742 TaxID=3154737 RepID=UPI0034298B7E
MSSSPPPERTPTPVKVMVGVLAVGVVLLCTGLVRRPWSDDVDCGGQHMRPGERCVSSRGSSATYEERRRVRENGAGILVAGGVITAGSLAALYALNRNRRDQTGEISG